MEVVLLIGAPGAGKSTLGKYLAQEQGLLFFSAGDWLREQGMLDTKTTTTELRIEAAAQLRKTLLSSHTDKPMLILEFVKDIEDAYALMEILHTTGSLLVDVVLIAGRTIRPTGRGSIEWTAREMQTYEYSLAKKYKERLPKWLANAGRLIEYFSSMQLLNLAVRYPESMAFFEQRQETKRKYPQPSFFLPSELRTGGLTSRYNNKRQSELRVAIQPVSWAVSPQLVTDKTRSDEVLRAATARAGLLRLSMPVPCVSLQTADDVEWVSQPGRYAVAHKCDGTRYLLLVMEDGAVYFKNRIDFVYAYTLDGATLPPNTILDGELVWSENGGYFFVFDALLIDDRRLWNKPFDQRLDAMHALTLDTDDQLPSDIAYDQNFNRQRMPSKHMTVKVVLKRHFTVQTLDIASKCSFPCDGLVFTPMAMPYATPLLMRKWQPKNKRACDIQGSYDLVYECCPAQFERHPMYCQRPADPIKMIWNPVAIRWDKTHGQGNEHIGSPCNAFVDGADPLHFMLSVRPVHHKTPPPPRITLPRQQCLEAVHQGKAQQTIDADTGLEIFNTNKGVTGLACRGVVFDSDRLVAAAFEPFGDTTAGISTDQWVNISLKIDGSLIIAFLHKGQLCVSTRRRMDSEQAQWAKRQLDPAKLQEGWTYAFEAVYSDNTVVVAYPFEGLVFLNAWSPEEGRSVAPGDRQTLSERLGVIMCAPSVECLGAELAQLIPVNNNGPPSFEGWVIEEEDGRRSKLVQEAYKTASREAKALHPIAVWHEIRLGGRRGTDKQTPLHIRNEKRAMETALEEAFAEELQQWYASLELEYDAQSVWNDEIDEYPTGISVVVNYESWASDVQFDHRGEYRMPATTTSCLKTNWFRLAAPEIQTLQMYYSADTAHHVYPTLRVRLMDRIRPADNGTMRYYTPSTNIRQTFAKAWTHSMRAQPAPLISSMLLEQLMEHIFNLAPITTLAKAIFVCKDWNNIIVNMPRFAERLKEYDEELRKVWDARDQRYRQIYDGRRYGALLSDYDDEGYGS